MTKARNTPQRYHLIDALRGLCLISMMAYHACYDLVVIFGVSMPFFFDTLGNAWQISICTTFIFLSGFSWNLGRKHLVRGLIVSACGLIITLGTVIFYPSELIIFGILTFMGLSMLIMIPLDYFMKKWNAVLFLLINIILFVLTYNISRGYIGVGDYVLFTVPDFMYATNFTVPLGMYPPSFQSADYFPLIPYFFLYLCGYFAWKAVSGSDSVKNALSFKIPLISVIGRHTLIVYMVHQPIIYGVLLLLDKIGII